MPPSEIPTPDPATDSALRAARDKANKDRATARRILARLARDPHPPTTARGRKVAHEMRKHFAPADHTRVAYVASLIGRRVDAYEAIQVAWCSDEMSDARRARMERWEASLEDQCRAIALAFPATVTGGRPRIKFGGDPRGYTIKIVIPGAPHDGNTWGTGGEYGIATGKVRS